MDLLSNAENLMLVQVIYSNHNYGNYCFDIKFDTQFLPSEVTRYAM